MRNVLVHAHIFKNAGTTFDFSLKNHFADNFVDHRDDALFIKNKKQYLLEYLDENAGVQALSSHSLHFQISGNDHINVLPVYFLRHPIARVWSVYNFEKRQLHTDTEGARRAKELDLNAYVEWYLQEGSPATIRNIHTIFLSGDGPSPHAMENKFALASETLDSQNTFIAVVERYDESMLLLEHQLSAYFPKLNLSYKKKNVSPESKSLTAVNSADALLEQLDKDIAEKLLQANAFDLALYERGNQKLDSALQGISELENRKRDLANRCRLLQD